jgi:hypothetical protein
VHLLYRQHLANLFCFFLHMHVTKDNNECPHWVYVNCTKRITLLRRHHAFRSAASCDRYFPYYTLSKPPPSGLLFSYPTVLISPMIDCTKGFTRSPELASNVNCKEKPHLINPAAAHAHHPPYVDGLLAHQPWFNAASSTQRPRLSPAIPFRSIPSRTQTMQC